VTSLKHLLNKNKHWAEKITQESPDFFELLSKQQNPEYLWIGCADSRVPANQIIDLVPGQVFVHRNVGNVVVHTDMNCLSVIQYAVEVLKVKHIIVCGHYGCGGVKAAMEAKPLGLIDNWLRNIQDVANYEHAKLAGLSKADAFDKLCELNVIQQAKNVCRTNIIQEAWRKGHTLAVHAWIYSLDDGLLRDLDVTVSDSINFAELMAARAAAGNS